MIQAALWGHGESADMGTSGRTPALPWHWASGSDGTGRAGAGMATGTTCTASFSPPSPSSQRCQTQAREPNHQRSSPLSGLIPGHRGRFADSARLPLKEAATKVNGGAENSIVAACPHPARAALSSPGSCRGWDRLLLAHKPPWSIPRPQPPCEGALPHLLSGDQEE